MVYRNINFDLNTVSDMSVLLGAGGLSRMRYCLRNDNINPQTKMCVQPHEWNVCSCEKGKA